MQYDSAEEAGVERFHLHEVEARHYSLYLKAHCAASDFEAECWAGDRGLAARRFLLEHRTTLMEYNAEDILRFIEDVTEINRGHGRGQCRIWRQGNHEKRL